MDFQVNRQDFRETRIVEADPVELQDGQVRLAVERWAFTSNNITYAVAGDMLDYWGFFPAEAPWGRIPAMGLGTVTESANDAIEVGGRYFSMYPMSLDLVIDARPHRDGFRDVGPHRANHAEFYTTFQSVDADDMFRADRVDEYLLLRGVFSTSFLIDDFLADSVVDGKPFHGATQTLVTSASSKTSISLAHCLAARGHHSVGLTSERNRAFVEGLNIYSDVITYDEVTGLSPDRPSVVVDMAGNGQLRHTIHSHFGDNLKFSSTVGLTHWEDGAGPSEALPGPTPEMFFAPGQMAKRTSDWGPAEMNARIAESFLTVLDTTPDWMTVEHHAGPEGVTSAYTSLLEGTADPAVGYVVSMAEDRLG